MSNENPNIIKNYLDKYFPHNYSNFFLIMNKIDLMDDEEKEKKLFEEEMLVNKLKINREDKTIHLHYLSCKQLTNEIKRQENFQSYLKYLLTEGNKEKKTNLFMYLKEKMVKEFQIDISKIGNESPNDEQKKEIQEKIKELKAEVSSFTRHLNPKEYFNYSKAFEKNKTEIKNQESQNNQLKLEKYKELFEDFHKSFTNLDFSFCNS